MKIFGERLKELRTEKGLSLIKLAKEIDISDATICRWENNKADVGAQEIVIIAKYFNVSADYLLGLED